MNSTSIIALLVVVLLAFVILVVIILLDHRKNAEEISLLEGGSTGEPSAVREEEAITIHESCKTGNMRCAPSARTPTNGMAAPIPAGPSASRIVTTAISTIPKVSIA